MGEDANISTRDNGLGVLPLEIGVNRGRLPSSEGAEIHFRIDTPKSPLGRTILVPPWGMTMADLTIPTYFLLRNRIEVVRFDPTFNLGESDGDIEGLHPDRAVADIRTVVLELSSGGTSVVAFSLACRIVIRALTDAPCGTVVLVAPVVHVQDTLRRVLGVDLVQMHLRGEQLPPRVSILGIDVPSSIVGALTDSNLEGLEGTVADARTFGHDTHLLFGRRDEWVDHHEVEIVGAALPHSTSDGLENTGHELFFNPLIYGVYMNAVGDALAAHFGLSDIVSPPFRETIRYARAERPRRRRRG